MRLPSLVTIFTRLTLSLGKSNVKLIIVHCSVKRTSVKHIPTLSQVKDWLEAEGFAIRSVYGDYRGRPVGEYTNRAIIWAEKI